MLNQAFNRLRERVLKWFPERQFFHRTGGEVNFFVLGTRVQFLLVSIGALLLLWCLITFGNLLWGQNPFSSNAKELRVQKENYERYMVDLQAQETSVHELLEQQQTQFQLAAKNFEDKHNTIVSMLTNGGIANTDTPDSSAYTNSKVMMSAVSLDPVERVAKGALSTAAAMTTGTVLDKSMVNLEQDQNNILLNGEEKILQNIQTYRAILQSTGIDLVAALRNGVDGMGGPYVSLDGEERPEINGELPPRLTTIQARTHEVSALKSTLDAAPFGFPIDAESYQTSPYGTRRDPFTKRPTRHPGVDIASYRMAPIVATSDGQVTFSGVRTGYGRVVEIDHGHGFKTRYAHLAKSYVKRGTKVKQGDKIAGMGSTGRSTSTHLHYEVLFENRTYDPNKFLKAGKYVQ